MKTYNVLIFSTSTKSDSRGLCVLDDINLILEKRKIIINTIMEIL